MVGERPRTSTPSDLPAWPWVSRSATSTRRPRPARCAATFTQSVVLQVPPFSLTKAMRRMLSARGRLRPERSARSTFAARPSIIDSSSASFCLSEATSSFEGRFAAWSACRTPLSNVSFAWIAEEKRVCRPEVTRSLARSLPTARPILSSLASRARFSRGS